MPKPEGSNVPTKSEADAVTSRGPLGLSAVVVSGGKQYRVAPGEQVLVDRLDAEPGSSLKLDRVLLFNDGSEVKLGSPALDGVDVEVKVLAHRRGPRIESLRYKSKKRVRVHRGGRADLTALQIVSIGGLTGREMEKEVEGKAAEPKSRGRAKTKKTASAAAAPAAEAKTEADAPARSTRGRRKKESE